MNKFKFLRFAILFCYVCNGFLDLAWSQQTQLEVLNSTHGLSQGMIYDILQDKQGFLWFATRGGLNRFDGYTFKIYKTNPFNPFSIADNTAQALLEDRQGRIWVGTENNGLDVFDPESERFFHLQAGGHNGLSNGNVLALVEAPDGSIWAGTNDGLNRIQLTAFPKENPNLSAVVKVQSFRWESPKGSPIFANAYHNLLCTTDGILWVGTLRQTYQYNLKTQKKRILPIFELGANRSSWQNNAFVQDAEGAVWVGQSRRLIRFKNGAIDSFPFAESETPYKTYLTFDLEGNLYVGRRKQIYLLSREEMTKNSPKSLTTLTSFPAEGIIGSTKIFCDRNGLIWMGTNGYGIRKYNPANRYFRNFLPGISTRVLYADRQHQLWAWDNQSTIVRVNQQTGAVAEPFVPGSQFYHHDLIQARDREYWFLGEWRTGPSGTGVLLQKNPQTGQVQQHTCPIEIGIFSQLLEDQEGNIWICGRVSSLACWDIRQKRFRVYDFSKTTGFKEASYVLLENRKGHFWVGTPHGLVRATLDQKQRMHFKLYRSSPEKLDGLSHDVILSLHEDPKDPSGVLWVGTRGGGLNRMNTATGTCRHYNIDSGLPDDVIYGILADSKGNLWLSTNSGLSKFSPQSDHFENYSAADGLQDNEFNTLSYTKGYDGRLYFGGVNGVTELLPEKISPSTQAPKVWITALKINNKPLVPGQGLLKERIESTRTIQLRYRQNHLTIDFAAMDFADPVKNQFKYRLLDADNDWIAPTTAHQVNYSNLAPGRYRFEVQSGGSHGVWPNQGEATQLNIHILPPWWNTTLAWLLYVMLLIGGVISIMQWRINQDRLKSQLEFEKRELARIQELEQLKSSFFTNITHELRTPLTLVIEPLRQIMTGPIAESWRSKVQLAERSGSRLLNLVNQLLDVAKLEGGAMPLILQRGSMNETIRQIAAVFEDQAKQKNIRLSLKGGDSALEAVDFDQDKVEKIVINLVSNALKFTPEGGQVILRWGQSATGPSMTFWLEVEDSGTGIPPEHQAHIFKRFYSLGDKAPNGQLSTGVGLSLCKELSTVMGGHLDLLRSSPRGTTFRLSLPLSEGPLVLPTPAEYVPEINPAGQPAEQPALIQVLLAEDDAEMRQFLVQTLSEGYDVKAVENGKLAFELAREISPDIIISDLAMPELDGLGLLQQLKNDVLTSHIPVVLLTARASLESRLSGLSYGAEAYLQKPFHTAELKAWIQTLLANRLRQQNAIRQEFSVPELLQEPAESVATLGPLDQDFLQRLQQVIYAELENENLNVEELARRMFLSRSQLHRKVIALTGLSTAEFLRSLRLEHAMHLLKTQRGKIAEIAQQVGFRNVKYFSTAFKEHFGKSPSEV